MITLKFYQNKEDKDSFYILEVDSLEMGYARKGRDVSESALKRVLTLTKNLSENYSPFDIDYSNLLNTIFNKIEISSENQYCFDIENLSFICCEINTKLNNGETNRTVFSFKEYVA